MALRVTFTFCTLALLAACSARGPLGQPSAFVPSIAGQASRGAGTLIVRVRAGTQPDFISSSTEAMTVDINGPTRVKKTVGLTVGANGCKSSLMTLQCTLVVPGLADCPSTKNCYTGTVTTYDAYNAKHKKIPPSAHVLSADQKFGFAITSPSTLIPLVLYGVPRSIAFVPAANSSLSGTQDAGFVEPKCTAGTQTVTVLGADADGNYILGVGAPAVSVTSSAPSQLAVTRSGPNSFLLTPPNAPNYAYGNFTTHLSLRAKPSAKSGHKQIATAVNVTYSGSICGIITEFPVPTAESEPAGITTGPDGNLWFTEYLGDKVGRISVGGSIAEFPVPAPSASPLAIVTGPDNNLWFTEACASNIGKMTTAGITVEYPTPTKSSEPSDITSGPNGNLWFTELNANNVAQITTNGTVTEIPVPTANGNPFGITTGPDGNLWFTESGTGKIGQATTAGTITEHSIPGGASSSPVGITTGADGALWFAECVRNYIGRITTGGTVLPQYPLPEPGSKPAFATKGPDGAVWFAEYSGNRIGSITTGGAFTEYATPTAASEPIFVTVGPDGSIWFTEFAGNKIGRLR
jgi:streptogramin lyase